jgi:hypothetical protein
MNVIKKLGLFHWNIGFVEESSEDILCNKKITKKIYWLHDNFKDGFFADPFILSVTDRTLEVLVEEYMYAERKGRISLLTVNKSNYTLISNKTVLDLQTHLSFPFIFRENNAIYVMPENCESGMLSIYEYNFATKMIEFKKVLIKSPLIDPILMKHDGLYYLLCACKGKNENADLYLYCSDSLMGDYCEVIHNPIKSDIENTRPGGGFFEHNGLLYRITQNCKNSYGGSVSLNKIISINKKKFAEETIAVIYPDKKYQYGVHTLNSLNGITVIDGLKFLFSPIKKIQSLMKRLGE